MVNSSDYPVEPTSDIFIIESLTRTLQLRVGLRSNSLTIYFIKTSLKYTNLFKMPMRHSCRKMVDMLVVANRSVQLCVGLRLEITLENEGHDYAVTRTPCSE